jgi:biotin transport system permease protein
MKSLYVSGQSWLHRISPTKKIGFLALFSVALFFTRDYYLLGLALIFASFVLAQVGISFRETIGRLLPVMLTIVAVAIFSAIFQTLDQALVTLLRLTSLTVLAAAITATVSIAEFMAVITRASLPFEKLGLVNAVDIGLSVGLVIRFVPEILSRYQALRDAHHARGLNVRAQTVIVPLIILTLKDADGIADAIDARGIRGHKTSHSAEP